MYLFNTVIESDLVPTWKRLEATLDEPQLKSIHAGAKALFSDVNDTIRDAVEIPEDRKIDPKEMLYICQTGFEELFGKAK